MVGVMGYNCAGEQSMNPSPVGVLVGPCTSIPNAPTKSAENFVEALNERCVRKARPFAPTQEEKQRIKHFIECALGRHDTATCRMGLFSKERIREAITRLIGADFSGMVSKKWSSARLEKAFADLIEKTGAMSSMYDLESVKKQLIKLSGGVKNEMAGAGPDGPKPPRSLIADGDVGQLASLAIVSVFEELLFTWMHTERVTRHIKHVAREVGITTVHQNLSAYEGVVEGDGSAWDATCSQPFRSRVESPVIYAIAEELWECGFLCEIWGTAYVQLGTAKKHRLTFDSHYSSMRLQMSAIRRSGERATSSLNWWANFTGWSCACFPRPQYYLEKKSMDFAHSAQVDVVGQLRHWGSSYEGDDSALGFTPRVTKDSALGVAVEATWRRFGFNMKIIYPSTRLEFCGALLGCVDGKADARLGWVPDLKRCLRGSCYSSSPVAVDAFLRGDKRTVLAVAAASNLSRAYDFAGRLAVVSRKYLDLAVLCYKEAGSPEFDAHTARELFMHTTGALTPVDLVSTIVQRNAVVSVEADMHMLRQIDCYASPEEIIAWSVCRWDPAEFGDVAYHRAALPRLWC